MIGNRAGQPCPTSITDAFRCLSCEYDLGGHSGDLRQCPECGRYTSATDMEIVERVRARGIRAFASPVLPAVAFLCLCLLALLLVTPLGAKALVRVIVGGIALIWILSLVAYIVRYRGRRGWLAFLCGSHLMCLLLPAGVFVLAGSGLALVFSGLAWAPLLLGVGGGMLLLLGLAIYRYMKRRIPIYLSRHH